METHNHSQQEVRSFSCQWMGFFSGGAFFMSMFESVFFIQHPPHNSADSGCLFSTDAETDNRDKSDMNSNHWFQHRLSLCVLHHAVGRVSSSLDWYFKWCALGFFFLQCREVGARATGVSAVVTATGWATTCQSDGQGCPLFSSALTHHQPVSPGQAGIGACTVLATRSQPSAGRCVASITEMWVFPFHPSIPFMTSSKEDRTVSALNIRSSWQIDFCTDELPHSFSCLFARVLRSTVQDMEKYNVKISVIWCPTNRLRFHFILPPLSHQIWTVMRKPFRVFLCLMIFMTCKCIYNFLMSELCNMLKSPPNRHPTPQRKQ